MSFSDSAGTLTATFGSEMPLLLDTIPPSTTRQTMSLLLTPVTSTATLPSSMSNRSPGFTSRGSFLYVVDTRSAVPMMSSLVIVTVSPVRHSCGPSWKRPSRIFGPCRSARMPTERFAALAASRTKL